MTKFVSQIASFQNIMKCNTLADIIRELNFKGRMTCPCTTQQSISKFRFKFYLNGHGKIPPTPPKKKKVLPQININN